MIAQSQKLWKIASPIPYEISQQLSAYSPVLQQLLFNRGIKTTQSAKQFLEIIPPEGCEPHNLLGVEIAVDRIIKAIQRTEKIAIYGDYDVDGVTATALLTLFLQSQNGDVISYIPNRFDEGYGLNIEALKNLHAQEVGLVVSVDCGIRSTLEAQYAKEIGMDLIITDHHHPETELPEAFAIINPKQPDDLYPDKNLSGVGIAYKLASAIYEEYSSKKSLNTVIDDYLDLVALGTVADISPLIGENRYLVSAGLREINKYQRQGLNSLMGVAGINKREITADDIGFLLGPRINAAGRLDTAQEALELLISQDVQRTGYLAQLLDKQNQQRQRITKEIQTHAEQIVLTGDGTPLILFAIDENYNPGVIGLAASKLQDKFYRPAIVAYKGEEFTRASCRSIPEFHITNALDQCAHLLDHHGGHAAAAGFTVRNNRLDELIACLTEISEKELGGRDLFPVLDVDMEIQLSELTPEIIHDLARLQPTGHMNPSALFASRSLQVKNKRTIGKDNTHLKLVLSDGNIYYDAIAFQLGHLIDKLPEKIDAVYAYELNTYNGRTSLQLNVKDLKPSGASG